MKRLRRISPPRFTELIGVRISPTMYESIKQLADEEELHISIMTRRLLEQALERLEEQHHA